MDMKNSREEEILTHLSEMDEELLDTAYSVDSPEKLREYIKSDSNKRRISVIRPAFYRVAALAACFVFIILAMVHNFEDMIPSSQSPSYNNPSYNNGFPTYGDDHSSDSKYPLYVDSISSLNYYCAMAAINESCSINYADVISDSVGSKIYYYELDPNKKFSVYRAEFFKINVTKEDGFFASVLGTGEVEVVITENSLENMITFKKGDKYFSCLSNGGSEKNGYAVFSTHKYIEGFNIVKNIEQNNYTFTVSSNKIICKPFINDGNNADGEVEIIGGRICSNVTVSFNVADLERYVKTNFG